MTSAEQFDQFAQGIDAKAAAKAAPAAEKPPEAVEAPPVDATPKPAEKPTEAPAPEVKAAPETPAEAKPDAPKPEEAPRDDKGRFVKVAVHAREISRRDTEITALKEQLEQAKQPQKVTVKSIEAFDKLKDKFSTEFPAEFQELIEVFKSETLSRDEKIEAMQARIDQSEREQQEAVEAQAEFARAETQKVIDSNETISGWQEAAEAADATAESKQVWDTAIEHDNSLRASPAWRDKPMSERFAEVARRTALDLGLEQPKVAAEPPKAATPPKAELPPKPLPAAKPPDSLSNIPQGSSPPTPSAPAEGMSLHGAIAATKGMSRSQAAKFLLGAG